MHSFPFSSSAPWNNYHHFSQCWDQLYGPIWDWALKCVCGFQFQILFHCKISNFGAARVFFLQIFSLGNHPKRRPPGGGLAGNPPRWRGVSCNELTTGNQGSVPDCCPPACSSKSMTHTNNLVSKSWQNWSGLRLCSPFKSDMVLHFFLPKLNIVRTSGLRSVIRKIHVNIYSV